MSEPTTCLRCGLDLQPGQGACPRCQTPRAGFSSGFAAGPAQPAAGFGQTSGVPGPTPSASSWTPRPLQGAFPGPTPTPTPGPVPSRPVAPTASAAGRREPVPLAEEIRLAHGEVIKRVFDIAGVSKSLGSLTAQLVVTDARVIYRARARHKLGESRNNREIQVADVNGVAMVTRRGFTLLSFLTVVLGTVLWWVLLPLILGLLASGLLLLGNYGAARAVGDLDVFFRILVLVVAAVIAWVRWSSTEVYFQVYGRNVGASPIGLSGEFGRQQPGMMALLVAVVGNPIGRFLRWLGVMDAAEATDEASPESVQAMYEEFGALILDLQNRGVLSED